MVQKTTRITLIILSLLVATSLTQAREAKTSGFETRETAIQTENNRYSPKRTARILSAGASSNDTNTYSLKIKKEGLRERTSKLILGLLGPRMGIFVLSMLPISELRGALLLWALDKTIHQAVPWWQASLIALLGNLIPVIPIVFLLNWIMKLLGNIGIFKKIFDWLAARAKRKGDLIERYEFLGVFLFVAIPLPFTGAWTGALIASVLRLNPWKSFLIICLGVLSADIVVTAFVLLKWWGLLAAVIILPLLWILSRWLEHKPIRA